MQELAQERLSVAIIAAAGACVYDETVKYVKNAKPLAAPLPLSKYQI